MTSPSPASGLGVLIEDAWKVRDSHAVRPWRVLQSRIAAFKRHRYYTLLNINPAIRCELQHLYAHWSLAAAGAFILARPGVLLADLIWSRNLTQSAGLPEARLHPGRQRCLPLPYSLSEREQRQLGYQKFPPRVLDEQTLTTTALRFYHYVIDGWTWQEIANAERVQTPSGGTAVPPVRSVIRSVQKFAAALGVTLPVVPRGRPRGRRIKP